MLVAGVSPAVQQELSRTVPGALLLPNALDLPAFDEALLSRDEALARLGLPAEPDTLTLAVVGRLIPWKRPELALAALAELGERARVRLVFVGDGPLFAAVRDAGRELPVHMAGFQQNARSLLAAFDGLLQVSEDREAFGMVALEAMAAGVPVLAQRAPGPAFLLGEDVYYADADPAAIAASIRQLQHDIDSGKAASLAASARSRVERHFSIAALAARLDDLFFAGAMD
jgi:glycosyltransferase involved in cell wall biosynthesis